MVEAHGGNIHALRREGVDAMDFSASINPLGMPRGARAALRQALSGDTLYHYPDPEAAGLRDAIAARYGIDGNKIIAGNGSTELIYLIPRALRPETVLVTAPTFSEFERAALAGGARIRPLALKEKDDFRVEPAAFIEAMRGAGMAVLCNPNNPTGRLLERDAVLEIARAANRMNCVLLVDEAFMDFSGNKESVLGEGTNNIIVLRSLTKFYALAGLRLGFGCFPGNLLAKLKKLKEPWSVNTLSQLAGAAALRDEGYIKRTLKLINEERGFLVSALTEMGMHVYPSEANYLLVRVDDATAMRDRMLRHSNIAIRDCGNFRGMRKRHIRVAVRGRDENMALLDAMRKTLKGKGGRVS